MELRTGEIRLSDLKEITRQVTWNINNLKLYDYPTTWFDNWDDLIGQTIQPSRVSVKAGVKYMYIGNQPLKVSTHVLPNTVSARTIYRPIQGREDAYNWVYGETIYGGFKRTYEGVIYQTNWDIPHDQNTVTPDKNDKWFIVSNLEE